jgi:hypothetical protein
MEAILVWVMGIVASAVITLLINDPLKFLAVRLFGGHAATARSLRGIWNGKYDYTTEGDVKVEEHYFVVRQIGAYVVAKTFSKGLAWYKLRGKLDQQGFLTGVWEERTPDGRFYHGAFQLDIHPQGNEMSGRWLGYNRHHVVMSGSWSFKRASFSVGKEEIAKYSDHQGWPQLQAANDRQDHDIRLGTGVAANPTLNRTAGAAG